MTTNSNTVDEYLEHLEPAVRAELVRIRTIAKQVVPDATEGISYGMPVLKLNGKYLIGFAAFKNHMSIFPGSEPIDLLSDELAERVTSKGTIQFTRETQLSEELIRQIVELCARRLQA
jgi:uncharacterized protein YdhG (YjbR/CyaY superfamily)